MNKEIFSFFNKNFAINHKVETIKDLQSKILSKKIKKPTDNIIINKTSSNFLHVISPFYDRNKVCHLKNCLCPYHKRLKQEIIKKKYESLRNNKCNTAAHSPSKDHKQNRAARGSHNPTNIIHHDLQPILEKKADYTNTSGKLQSFNQQYEKFLKSFDDLLRKKQFEATGNHIVKTPVWQIFNYIYHHLDDKKDDIQKYIDSLQKDREIKCFYIQRFQDLKKRKNNAKSQHQRHNIFQFNNTYDLKGSRLKKLFKPYNSFKQQHNKSQQLFKNDEKLSEKYKKSQKFPKLTIQILIQKVKAQDQIEQKHLLKFTCLTEPQFLQNIDYLKAKMAKFSDQLLQQIKSQILQAAKELLQEQLQNKQQNAKIINKIKIISQMITCINEKIEGNQQQQQKDSIISETSSLLKISRNRQNKQSQKRKSMRSSSLTKQKLFRQLSKFHDPNKSSEKSQTQQQSQLKSQKLQNINSQFFQDDKIDSNTIQNLILKENRIYSHGFFQRKKYFSNIYTDEIENANALQKLHNLQDVQIYLRSLVSESSINKKKMKQIQKSLDEYNIQNLLVKDNQNLITVKRKLRAIKHLIQDQKTVPQLKKQFREYIILAQKHAMAKNYNWAYTKLKNISSNWNQVELNTDQLQNLQALMKQILSNIFTQTERLYFYNLNATIYRQKSIDFQKQFFQSIKNDISHHNKPQYYDDRKISLKTNTNENRQIKKIERQNKKETDLIQVGLENRYFSQYNYQQTINYRYIQQLKYKYLNNGKEQTRTNFCDSIMLKK